MVARARFARCRFWGAQPQLREGGLDMRETIHRLKDRMLQDRILASTTRDEAKQIARDAGLDLPTHVNLMDVVGGTSSGPTSTSIVLAATTGMCA